MLRRPTFACAFSIATGLLVAAGLVTSTARAQPTWPPDESKGPVVYSDPNTWPNDPDYGGMWELWSFVPDKWLPNVTDENKRLGTGDHVDRAWAKTIGDRRILISVLDSGANWSNAELVNKWHLNEGEVPAPKGCPGADGMTWDINGDGYFNVQDFTTVKGHATPTFAFTDGAGTKHPSTVCDPRLTDANHNGILDPQDLIAAFSDGRDDDANGYVDDICGWDFYRNDNDAMDDTGYGHGNGEATDSSAEGNNGQGGIGTCPECSVQLLRVGDSFLADMNNFGMAALYAVDSGSSVIQEALGTIDNTALGKAAIDYAYENNVVIIASMADEDSYHHNFPAANNHVFTVHAVTHDSASVDTSTTFLNFNNCTDYGAQLAGSVSGASCSSEATGKSAGMAGLIYAAALQANIPAPPTGHAGDPMGVRRLSAEEVIQLFVGGVDDIYDPADALDPTKYPTRPGWQQRFGYGRVNARSSVDAVVSGKLPPHVEFRSPEWFEVIDPAVTPKLAIVGKVDFRNAPGDKFGDTLDYVLEWAPGNQPDDNAWKTIAMGSMMNAGLDGPLGTLDVSNLTIDNPTQGPPDNLVNRYMFTLRLRATVHSTDPKHDGATGQARRAAFLDHDPDMLPGFPIHLGTSGEASLKLYDLDGDGKREIIAGDSNGRVHAFRADGTELPGWPVKVNLLPNLDPARGASHAHQAAFVKGEHPLGTDWRAAVLATPAIGDIDGDGKAEVFVADYNGNLNAFHADGSQVKGWPQSVDRSIVAERKNRKHPAAVDDAVFAAPAMADFNGDKINEIVVADGVGEVTVWKGDGTKLPGWPVRVWDTSLPDDPNAMEPRQANRITSAPALGDLDGDGVPDIVVGTNETYQSGARLYAISGKTGQFLPGWPIAIVSNYVLPVVGSGIPNAPAMADLNGDGIPEIVVAGIGGAIKAYDAKGNTFGRIFPNARNSYGAKSNLTDATTFAVISNPAFGDIDDDGVVDLLYGLGGDEVLLAMATGGMRRDFQFGLGAWDTKTGDFKPGFPQVMEDYQFFLTPLVADIDGDGRSEVINGSAGYFLHAFNSDGVEAKGFPKFTGQWIASTPSIGDLDGDGKLEIACFTREGWLYAWHTGGKTTGRIDWESMRHDERNTGNYETPLSQGSKAMPKAPAMPKPGCSCAVGARGVGAASRFALWAIFIGLGLGLSLGRRLGRRRTRRSY